jgi:hypothetical protein
MRGGDATLVAWGCCHQRLVLLPAAAGPTGVATIGDRLRYNQGPVLLQGEAGVGTLSWRRCYNGTAVLLSAAAVLATKPHRRYYRGRPAVLGDKAASCGRLCFKGGAVVLPWEDGAATKGGRPCYQGRAVLPRRSCMRSDYLCSVLQSGSSSRRRCFNREGRYCWEPQTLVPDGGGLLAGVLGDAAVGGLLAGVLR